MKDVKVGPSYDLLALQGHAEHEIKMVESTKAFCSSPIPGGLGARVWGYGQHPIEYLSKVQRLVPYLSAPKIKLLRVLGMTMITSQA